MEKGDVFSMMCLKRHLSFYYLLSAIALKLHLCNFDYTYKTALVRWLRLTYFSVSSEATGMRYVFRTKNAEQPPHGATGEDRLIIFFMKKKALKLNRLLLKKDTIGSLVQEKIKGGVSEAACSIANCSMRCTGPAGTATCGATVCGPCQTGNCTNVAGCDPTISGG